LLPRGFEIVSSEGKKKRTKEVLPGVKRIFPQTRGTYIARGVSHCGLAIYIKKYLKIKRRIMETQIFHHAKI
jgi:hypothetical protein